MPFFLAPRVSDLDDFLRLTVIESEQLGSDQTVSVSIDKAHALYSRLANIGIGLACHGRAHRVRLQIGI